MYITYPIEEVLLQLTQQSVETHQSSVNKHVIATKTSNLVWFPATAKRDTYAL